MTIELSEAASNAMLNMLSALMDGGSIELQSDNGKTLAVLKLGNPAAKAADDGTLVFNPIGAEDAALAEGIATTARVSSSDGSEVFLCDVGDVNSDAVIKLHPPKIYRGTPVLLRSFTLEMP